MKTEKKHHIINASIKIIAENGIQGLTTKNIANECGFAEGNIYRYFKSKTGILMAILNMFEERNQEFFNNHSINDYRPEAILRKLFESKLDMFVNNPLLASVIFSEEIFAHDNELSAKIFSIMQAHQEYLIPVIEAYQKEHHTHTKLPPKHLAIMYLGTLRLLVTRWRLSNYAFDLKKEGIEVFATISKILK